VQQEKGSQERKERNENNVVVDAEPWADVLHVYI
jgi:hypothetical protein